MDDRDEFTVQTVHVERRQLAAVGSNLIAHLQTTETNGLV